MINDLIFFLLLTYIIACAIELCCQYVNFEKNA